jgi:hypothetical protein
MAKPSVNTKCVANTHSGPDERIVEVFDSKLQKGCLISVRRLGDRLIVEVYRGDKGVLVRLNQADEQVPS